MSIVTAYFYTSGGRIVSTRTGARINVEADVEESKNRAVILEGGELGNVDNLYVGPSETLTEKAELTTLDYPDVVPVGDDIVITGLPEATVVTWPDSTKTIEYSGSITVTATVAAFYEFTIDHPAYVKETFIVNTDPLGEEPVDEDLLGVKPNDIDALNVPADNEILKYNLLEEAFEWVPDSGGPANTDELAEGATNLYYTDARVLSAVSGDGYIKSVSWGDITGTLSNQADLQTVLNDKLEIGDLALYTQVTGNYTIAGDWTFSTPLTVGGTENVQLILDRSSNLYSVTHDGTNITYSSTSQPHVFKIGASTGGTINSTGFSGDGSQLTGIDTDQVTEGTNLYFTDARAVTAIKADLAWNATDWDTAFGWGDWSTGVDKPFVDALNVDADTLDGLNSLQFLRSDVDDSYTGTITNNGELHSFAPSVGDVTKIRFGRSSAQYCSFFGDAGGNYFTSVSSAGNPKSNVRFGYSIDGGATLDAEWTLNGSSGTIWHSGNDGAGSGLDADTLDGLHASAFLRVDGADSATGQYSFTGNIGVGTAAPSTSYGIYANGDAYGIRAHGSTMGGRFEDSNSSATVYCGYGAYDVYASGTGRIDATSSIRAPIFYDRNNTSFFFHGDNTGDSIRVAGDVVAFYSDERLKTKTGNITNATDKINSLEAFTYTQNELADKYGYSDNKPRLGLSAQQVQKIAPEVVGLAPFDTDIDEDTGEYSSKSGENYLTVDYARLVPLLVAAIKEQNETIEHLTERVNQLESK